MREIGVSCHTAEQSQRLYIQVIVVESEVQLHKRVFISSGSECRFQTSR